MLVHNIINMCSTFLFSMSPIDGLENKRERPFATGWFRLTFLDLQLIKEHMKYKLLPQL